MIKFLIVFLLFVSFTQQTTAQCVYTSTGNGTWGGSNWSVTGTPSGGGTCSATPSPSNTGGGISTGEIININHTITVSTNMQINNATHIVINNGGTLDMVGYELSTSWGIPLVTINTGGTLQMASLNFANGTFTNSGTITATGDMTFTAGTITLANSTTSTSYITTDNLHITSTSVTVSVDGELEITGNLHANSGSTIVFNENTNVSGYINFAGGQAMSVSSGVLLKAPTMYVQNSSNLVVDGFLHATGNLSIGWTPGGAQSGSSRITGTGNVGWGTLSIDNNDNYMGCVDGTNYGYCTGCLAPPPPHNPLDLTNCDAGVLSVNFVHVEATYTENTISIHWVTGDEKDNNYFNIERYNQSTDSWVTLGKVDGAGYSNGILSYSFSDFSFGPGTNYYRIRQVDFDEKSSYSSIVSCQTSGIKHGIFPQPLTDNYLHVNYPDLISWSVYTISGIPVSSGDFSGTEKSNRVIDLSSSRLKPGVYILQLQFKNEVLNQKIIVGSK